MAQYFNGQSLLDMIDKSAIFVFHKRRNKRRIYMTQQELNSILTNTSALNDTQLAHIVSSLFKTVLEDYENTIDSNDIMGSEYLRGEMHAYEIVISLLKKLFPPSTTLTTDEITFLYSVIQHLNAKGTFTLEGNNVTLRYKAKGQHEITTHFDKNLLEKYYNRPCSFITEVL